MLSDLDVYPRQPIKSCPAIQRSLLRPEKGAGPRPFLVVYEEQPLARRPLARPLALVHRHEGAVPAVVPDLTRIDVDAEHAGDPAVSLGVQGVIAVECFGFTGLRTGRDAREVVVGYLPRPLGAYRHLVAGVPLRGRAHRRAHHASSARTHH